MSVSPSQYQALIRENAKLRDALSSLIPWAGELPDGPSWATEEAKQRNREMFDEAFEKACNCFPDGYNELSRIAESN